MAAHRRLRRFLAWAHRATAPAPVAILEGLFGLFDNRVLGLMVDLGIPDLVRRPRTATELADRVGADPDSLERVLRYAASRGFVKARSRGRYGQSRVSRFLERDHPGDWAASVRRANADWFWEAWRDLAVSVGVQRDLRSRVPIPAVETAGSTVQAAALSRDLSWKGVSTVCDVGGGSGIVVENLLFDHPHLNGILFDRAPVIAEARPALRSGGLATRCRLVAGDYLERVPGGADRYVLMAIMTECTDDRAVRLLWAVRNALTPRATALVVDNVLSERPIGEIAQTTDLLLLALGVGRERTRAQYHRLFADAGLELVYAHALSTGSTAFELRRRRG